MSPSRQPNSVTPAFASSPTCAAPESRGVVSLGSAGKSSLALRVEGIEFQYAARRVLRDVSCEIPVGSTLALTGENGAGKTTLLRCLCGLATPLRGEIWLAGEGVASGAWTYQQKQFVGFAAHARGLYLGLSARENLELAARLHGLPKPRCVADHALEACGLVRRADEPVRHLSQGMCQRLSLVRAFLHEPRLRLLDEPFSHLDEANRQWLESWMRSWPTAGVTTVFSTHDRDHARSLADLHGALMAGRLHVTRALAATPTLAHTRDEVAADRDSLDNESRELAQVDHDASSTLIAFEHSMSASNGLKRARRAA